MVSLQARLYPYDALAKNVLEKIDMAREWFLVILFQHVSLNVKSTNNNQYINKQERPNATSRAASDCRPRALVIMPPGKTRSHMRGFVGAVLGLPARQHFLMRSPIGSYLHP